MTIYLDFDGTVVEHDYPRIGKPVPMALEVIRKLSLHNYWIILNTYRVDLVNKYLLPDREAASKELDECLTYFVNNGIVIDAIVRPEKRKPYAWNIENALEKKIIYIDDVAPRIPLISSTSVNRPMVDWKTLDEQFKQYGIYD